MHPSRYTASSLPVNLDGYRTIRQVKIHIRAVAGKNQQGQIASVLIGINTTCDLRHGIASGVGDLFLPRSSTSRVLTQQQYLSDCQQYMLSSALPKT